MFRKFRRIMAGEKQESFKILMFPWLAHGHIIPYLQLSKNLIATHDNFTIYLCSTAVNLHHLSKHATASLQLVELHMPSPPELPPHLHTTKNLSSHLIPTLIKAFQESTPSFTQTLQTLTPDLIIFDIFQPWAPKIASSMGIPSVYFSTSGASSISYYHHIYTYATGAGFPFPALSLPESHIARMKNRGPLIIKDADDDFAFGIYRISTDFVLVKSCRCVEEKYVDYLSTLCKKRIVCTGPLIASDADEDDMFEKSEIMEWLNKKEVGSTIYISFGSECFLSKEQIGEIAKGLLLNKDVNFLWVVRFPFEERERRIEEEMPVGFLEAVGERGLVVTGWAAQRRILGHPSVGGFMSHCGRSSVTESLYFGVPVVAAAMNVEQPLNAQWMVELGAGVEVEREGGVGVYLGEEIGRAIEKVMVVEKEGLRNRASRLSEVMREKEGEEVREVACGLLDICVKNKKI
ncbi:beta-D-glucosyl crocetin beta-1,6-glucosyltransferase-like [Salvia hispanica]|uniref:beta-D-glucosyl crocetin beta-1,6-glucosyltransferase-like n=1 Tax=Salvia hispanica TaxID=49212 RepID=UPI002009CFB1|nr:beta-D-glucosyl crocetin beta-1,6-glucosyltransferase-like [Salvia hispanica]XP_047977653.1 beta-D-glucosyl crocetin beta-1,6-glucosyltransferase-like [Salvia hispanica]